MLTATSDSVLDTLAAFGILAALAVGVFMLIDVLIHVGKSVAERFRKW